MATTTGSDITITSLTGGMNDTDPPSALPDDQCVLAENVEFFDASCGQRRAGCDPLDMTNSGINGSAITVSSQTAVAWSAIGITLAPLAGQMAFSNSTTGSYASGVNTLTVAFTVGATANYMICCVVGDQTLDKITGVTYNAVAMTQLIKYHGTGVEWMYIYGLASPTVGAHNVVISASGVCTIIGCENVAYINASATQPDNTTTTSSASSMGVTTTLTPVAAGSWAVQFSRNQTGLQAGVIGGTVRLSESSDGLATVADSNGPIAVQGSVVHLSQWFPTNDVANPELWVVGATPTTSNAPVTLARRTNQLTGTLAWFQVNPVDPFIPSAPDVYRIDSQPLNAKLFWAYSSGLDRLHVWDTTTLTLRRTGLAQPLAAPTAANNGGAGGYATVRYFRTRWITKTSAGVILRRSEPSLSVTFTPSGLVTGALITNSGVIGEGETHWELEASLDNATFYRTQTLTVATTTAIDTTAAGTGYATNNTLSEAIGAYLLQPSMKYLATDGARLLMAGHWTDPLLQSTVAWSPVSTDPGVGNDERQPIVTTGGAAINTTQGLDPSVGGPITGIAAGMITPAAFSLSTPTSVFYAFKWSRIYMLVATGDVTGAYKVTTLSTVRGAIPGSVFNGVDETGTSCVYFLDPLLGPSRIGQNGMQLISGLRKTWKRVNLNAGNVIACGVYYPYKQQAHWWVAVDSNNSPNLRMVLQISEVVSTARNEVGRGWALWTGRSSEALCAEPYTEQITDNGAVSLSTRPFIGLTYPDYVQRTDVNYTDAGQSFVATIVTAPRVQNGLLGRWAAITATFLAKINSSASIVTRLIRNLGSETSAPVIKSLGANESSDETFVFKDMDNLAITNARSIQVKISDS